MSWRSVEGESWKRLGRGTRAERKRLVGVGGCEVRGGGHQGWLYPDLLEPPIHRVAVQARAWVTGVRPESSPPCTLGHSG